MDGSAARGRFPSCKRWPGRATTISKRCSLPSRRRAFFWLLSKEWRQLVFSRSWWVLLLAMGPLTGVCFMAAVRSYADISGLGGTSAGVGEALWPLLGVWAP